MGTSRAWVRALRSRRPSVSSLRQIFEILFHISIAPLWLGNAGVFATLKVGITGEGDEGVLKVEFAGPGHEFVGRAVGHDDAADDDGDMVAEALGLVHIVGAE